MSFLQREKEKIALAVKKNKVLVEKDLEDLIDVFCPDERNHNVLRLVFKGSPCELMTIRLTHLGDREKWEDVLKEYIHEKKESSQNKIFSERTTKDRISLTEYIEMTESRKTTELKDILQENVSEGQKSLSNHIMSQCSKHLSMSDEEEEDEEEEDEEKGEEQTEQMMTKKIMDPSCSLPNVLPNIYMRSQTSNEGLTASNMTSIKTIELKHSTPLGKTQAETCKTDHSSFVNTAEKMTAASKLTKRSQVKVLA